MAFNFVEAVEAQLTPDAVTRAGVLATTAAIIDRGSTRAGAADLLTEIETPQLATSLLGERADEVIDGVARSSETSRSTASSVVSAILPVVAGVLSREVITRRLDADGLSELLQSQKRYAAVGVYDSPRPRAAVTKKPTWTPLLALVVGAFLIGSLLLLMVRGRAPMQPHVSGPIIIPNIESPAPETPKVPPYVPPTLEEPVGQTTTTGAAIGQVDELSTHFIGTGALPDRFALPGINFEVATTEMTGGGVATVDRLAALMKEHPNAKLRLEGHTDSVGSAAVNAPLSESRAVAVKKMLVDRGIEDARIETAGKRETDPIAPNDTREGRAQNRRIDAVILER